MHHPLSPHSKLHAVTHPSSIHHSLTLIYRPPCGTTAPLFSRLNEPSCQCCTYHIRPGIAEASVQSAFLSSQCQENEQGWPRVAPPREMMLAAAAAGLVARVACASALFTSFPDPFRLLRGPQEAGRRPQGCVGLAVATHRLPLQPSCRPRRRDRSGEAIAQLVARLHCAEPAHPPALPPFAGTTPWRAAPRA